MITSGLVITLSTEANLATQAIAKISARAEFTPGERNDRWLPVAMEAADDAHARELHDWIGAQPGVEFVDVVSVSFDGEDVHPTDSEQPQMKRKTIRGRPESVGNQPAVQFSALND